VNARRKSVSCGLRRHLRTALLAVAPVAASAATAEPAVHVEHATRDAAHLGIQPQDNCRYVCYYIQSRRSRPGRGQY
jgi:hypothetical protein